MNTVKVLFFLVIILGVAALFRFSFLSSIPPGIHPDAAANGIDAWDALVHNNRQVFYEGNSGREGLFINFISYSFDWFGPSLVAYKLPGCLIGLLSVLGMYFLGKEITQKQYGGLIASFLMATSFWMVIFDRTGFRATLSVCSVIWVSFFLLRAFRTTQWHDYALAGIFLGVGLHSYTSFRFMPLVVVAAYGYALWAWRKLKNASWLHIFQLHKYFILTVVIALFIFSPLLQYYLVHPETFMGRAHEVSVFTQSETSKHLWQSTTSNLLFFNISGDPNWRHNVARLPALDTLLGAFFLAGVAIVGYSLIKKRESAPDTSTQTRVANFFMLCLLGMMIIPAAITYSPGGIPHALRIINTAPAVYLLVTIAAVTIYERVKNSGVVQRPILLMSITLLATYLVTFNAVLYFMRWGDNGQVAHEFSEDYTHVSDYIKDLSATGSTVLLVSDSSELQFFLLAVKNVIITSKFEAVEFETSRPDVVVFSNFGQNNIRDREILITQGMQMSSGLTFGRGGHTVVVFSR
ncbi:MAG: glycosyltransferase family 39 protein [Candidatus Kerfeldbacteria bacterium]|nr:glycosyltransferase family 39 protein [Candidatus Kerfeldbacteria bacterium]